MFAHVKVLQLLSTLVSSVGLLLIAGGHWFLLGTGAPLIVMTGIAAIHYRKRWDLSIANARSSTWRDGIPAEAPPRTSTHSSG